MKRLLLSGLMAVFFCAPALAGSEYNVCFFSMDRDGDGAVSAEEFRAAFPDGGEVFGNADADGNTVLGHEEWEAYKESRGFEDAHGG